MVVIPAGRLLMGSPEKEEGRQSDEGPQHEVTFARPFAMGKYEVTFEEYDDFAQVTGRTLPDDEGWGRGRRPVINVSWESATAYAEWLSSETGKAYRLRSEAEWEYAARAKTATARYWGEDPDEARGYANVHDLTSKKINKFDWTHHACDDGFAQTASVGRFRANGFELKDMLGNVWEWVEDCWNTNYEGAPIDGSPWTSGNCGRRVLRGGSWYGEPDGLRSAGRNSGFDTDGRSGVVGFRLARTLD